MCEGCPTHDATDEVIVRRSLAKPKIFLDASFRFNDDSSGDARFPCHSSEAIHEKIPSQHLHAICHPRLARGKISPEVVVCIDAFDTHMVTTSLDPVDSEFSFKSLVRSIELEEQIPFLI
jgi:hypothetical protein